MRVSVGKFKIGGNETQAAISAKWRYKTSEREARERKEVTSPFPSTPPYTLGYIVGA